jgi:UDP-2-acetamido-3-amino-2,3-dideoxy-glucuronate N-acetyltransferase
LTTADRRGDITLGQPEPVGPDPSTSSFVHPTAIVEQGAVVGPGTTVWHHSHIRAGSRIGVGCTIGFCVYVDTEVVVGDHCKIQNHVSVYRGVVMEDEVFVGPAATFTNDLYPRAASMDWDIVPTVVHRGSSIGANATVVCGVELGPWSMVGAGAVVTADVPAHALVIGTPARLHAWVCVCGQLLARTNEAPPEGCRHCGRASKDMVRA